MIIWGLFDSETATVAKALPEHEVYSFGIGGGTEHIHLDLSDFETARKELEKYPKPDVIFASPPCETWISLSSGNLRFYKEKGRNLYWKDKWNPFDFNEKQRKRRMNGVNTALTTARIIQHFNSRYWAIENGSSSLIFDYMKDFANLVGIKSKCRYSAYDFNVLKPTIIYSNVLLCLKTSIPMKDYIAITEGDTRSIKKKFNIRILITKKNKEDRIEACKVPPLLYRDIMCQFKHGRQKTLF